MILMQRCKKYVTHDHNFLYTNEIYLHKKIYPSFLSLDLFLCDLWPNQLFRQTNLKVSDGNNINKGPPKKKTPFQRKKSTGKSEHLFKSYG